MANVNDFRAGSGALTKEYIQHIERTLDVMWQLENEVVQNLSELFDVESAPVGADWLIRPVSSHAPQPQIVANDLAAIPYYVPAPGFKATFTKVIRKLAVRVTQDLLERERFGEVMAQVGGQVKAARRNDEYQRADILNNGFSGTGGSDSLPLFDSSHLHENPEAGTWDNLSTGALTGDNLWALVLLQDNITDPQNDPMDLTSQKVWVPTALRRKALQLTKSALTAEDALNSEEQVITDLNVKVSKYFTSTTAHFVSADQTGRNKGLHEVIGSAWSMIPNNPSNGTIKIDRQLRSDKVFGFSRSKNLVGSAG